MILEWSSPYRHTEVFDIIEGDCGRELDVVVDGGSSSLTEHM